MPPVKNPCDFLRRHYPHQVIGSKFGYFLSACINKLPCIYFTYDCTPFAVEIQGVFQKNPRSWHKKSLTILQKHTIIIFGKNVSRRLVL